MQAQTAVAALVLFGLPAGAAAEADIGVSGKDELVKTIPVTKAKKAKPSVVMRLKPGQIPALAAGQVIKPAAELEVTTQCDLDQGGRRCAYDPKVRVWLVLSGRKGDTSAGGSDSMALGGGKQRSCSKLEHHCLIVYNFNQAATPLADGAPPCVAADSCYINLVAMATHRKAGHGDRLIIGANDGDFLHGGGVEPGKGRLMVLLERGERPVIEESKSRKNVAVPTNAHAKKILSVNLGKLVRGSNYAIEAKVKASASRRARFSTKMFLTKDRREVEGNGIKGATPRHISEHNGINCIHECKIRRIAVFGVDQDSSKPVFLNLFAKSKVPDGGQANVKATGYSVRIMRYASPSAARPPENGVAPRLAGIGQNEPYGITCDKARLDGWVNPHGSRTTWFFEVGVSMSMP